MLILLRPLLILVTVLWPSLAMALPTPDVLISSAGLVSTFVTAAITFLAGLLLLVRGQWGKLSGHHQVNILITLLLAFFFSTSVAIYQWSKLQKEENDEIITGYFSSDLLLDNYYQLSQKNFSNWLTSPPYIKEMGEQRLTELINKVKQGKRVLFFDMTLYGIHSTQRPVLEFDNQKIVAKHLFEGELLSTLQGIIKQHKQRDTVVLFNNLLFLKMRGDYPRMSPLVEALSAFDSVYAFTHEDSWKYLKRYVWLAKKNKLVEAKASYKKVIFPVRDEPWFWDHRAINFPNAYRLIGSERLSHYINDGAIVIAPYDSHIRDHKTQQYFMKYYFGEFAREVISFDIASADIRQKMEQLFGRLLREKRPIVTVAVGKDDALYYGNDLMLLYYEWLLRLNLLKEFRYEGGCISVYRYAAKRVEREALALKRQKMQQKLRKRFYEYLGEDSQTSIPLAGLLCYLLGLPLFWSWARDKNLRAIISDDCEIAALKFAHGPWRSKLLGSWVNPSCWTIYQIILLMAASWLFYDDKAKTVEVGLLVLISFLLGLRVWEKKWWWIIGMIVGSLLLFKAVLPINHEYAYWLLTSLGLQSVFDFIYKYLFFKKSWLDLLKRKTTLTHRPTKTKAGRLMQMEAYGGKLFELPKSQIVMPSEKNSKIDFAGPYIVRSSCKQEDGETSSLAGKFISIGDVATHAELIQAIEMVRASYQGIASEVLVQEELQFDISGVMFTRSIDCKQQMTVEWVHGHLKELVQGEQAPKKVQLGRWSIRPNGEWEELTRELVERLWVMALVCEAVQGAPQDLEWGYQRKAKRLYLLQSRPITKTNDDAAWRSAALERLGMAFLRKLRSGGVALSASGLEQLQNLNEASWQMVAKHYEADGVAARAAKRWGLELTDSAGLLWRYEGKVWLKQWVLQRSVKWYFCKVFHSLYRRFFKQAYVQYWHKRVFSAENFMLALMDVSYAAQMIGPFFVSPEWVKQIFSETYPRSRMLLEDRWLWQQGELSDDEFCKRWGHRRDNDYDIALPTYQQRHPVKLLAKPNWKSSSNTVDLWPLLKELTHDEYFRTNPQTVTAAASQGEQGSVSLPDEVNVYVYEGLTDGPPSAVQHIGVWGEVSGTIVDVSTISKTNDLPSGPLILWSENLPPELVEYLPVVVGVITVNAGQLSHCAIVAREMGKVVLSGQELIHYKDQIGKQIRIYRDGRINLL